MLQEIQNKLDDFQIEKITRLNFSEMMDVFSTNESYFLLTEGSMPDFETCMANIDALPAGLPLENKHFFAIRENNQVIGILDLLTGYPESGCIWIGLLLIHGDLHGKHYGKKITRAVLNSARVKGCSSVQLGVIECNEKGLRFWDKMAFQVIGNKIAPDGRKVIIMENLTAGAAK